MGIGPRLSYLQPGPIKSVAPAREQRPDSNTANEIKRQFVDAEAARTETLSCQQSNAKERLASRLKQRIEDRPPISDASHSQLTVFKMPEKLSGPQVVESLKSQFSRYLVDSAETDRGVCEFAISEMVDDDKAYCLLIHKDLAIICPAVESQSEKSAAQILSDSSLNDVRVYDFSEPLGGYPRLYSDTFLNASCDLYTSGELPDVILHKIEGLQFSPEKFVNKDIVQFVTETLLTPFVAQNPELGAKMQRIVQTSILNAGAEVRISKRVDDDIDIKNRINMVLINDDSENPVGKYEALLLSFLDSLNSDKEKAMVGFLLGRMARNGVLGYEYSSQNQANILFYSLAKTCFSRLDLAAFIGREQDGGQGFLSDLERGVCMDTLSKEFELANPFVRNVFAKVQEIQM